MPERDMKPTSELTPDHFDISIGGYGGTCYRVAWEDGALHYYVSEGFPIDHLSAEVEPTPSDWERFWTVMDEVKLWTWEASYHARILDGTQWEVEIEQGSRHIESSGSNRYPGYREEGVEDGYATNRFERFTKGVSTLIGGRPFE
jgi:hypothetical protein